MSNQPTVVAAFDFDGTLTTRDTLIAFIRYTHGVHRMCLGFMRHAHLLVLMKCGLKTNEEVKQIIFSYFYKGVGYTQFCQWGESFALQSPQWLRQRAVDLLANHQRQGHTTCVVTASIYEWVAPICQRLGIDHVLATRVEISQQGLLTGRFLTPNCRGKEKVHRLQEVFSDRSSYTLYVYGDSRGDRELLAYADHSVHF